MTNNSRSLLGLLRRGSRSPLVACFLLALLTPAFAQQGLSVSGSISVSGTTSLVTFTPAAPPDTSFAAETNINTSACGPVSLGAPAYCFDNWGSATMPNLTTCTDTTGHCPSTTTKLSAGANTNAQTILLTPTGNVSPLTIAQSYLPPQTGTTKTQIIWATQPWFAPPSGTGSNCHFYPAGGFVGPSSPAGHPCSGYDMSRADVTRAQQNQMIWQGAGAGQVINSPDWYGNKNGGGFLEKVIVQEAADALSRCAGSICPIDIEIMIDKGLITSGMAAQSGTVGGVAWSNAKAIASAATSYNAGAFVMVGSTLYVALSANTNQNPTTATTIWETNTTCVINSLKAAMDHIDGLWGNQVYYAPSPTNPAHHGLLTFLIEGDFTSVNWGTVWSTIATFQKKYKTPYDIFHWRDGFIEANQAGAYIWSQIQVWDNSNPSIQYQWDNGSSYQANFYQKAQNSAQTGIGTLFAGYDGSNNNYNNRVMSRQCGNVLLLNSKAIFNAKPKAYSASFPLPAVVMQTFNDLGETNLEGGEDNCWRNNTPTYAGSTLSWQVVGTNPSGDLTGLTVATIDHFKIMFGDGSGPLWTAQDNITPAAAGCTGTTTLSCSFNLATATQPPFPIHTFNVYVKMIPKALMLTQTNGAGTNQAPLVQAF